MNVYFLLASVGAVLLLVWQFTVGLKKIIAPLKGSELDPIAKTLLQCGYHFQSVMLLCSAAVLVACGFDVIASMQGFGVVLFIAMFFGMCSIWQLYISFISEVKQPFVNVNHWLLYALISIFSLLGALN
ncbi:hypothetical protein [Shewanella waksmanii]|uniref:hypothetical protein n=1 Tax=Shewanella waksmanii TaxID=213783 RepID=UPI00373636E1